MRFLATVALLFVICIAALLAVSYQLAARYRPASQMVTPLDVRGPAPGGITAQARAGSDGQDSGWRWTALTVLLLGCAVLQAAALVLLRVNALPWLQVGVTSLALLLWAVAWWLDRLTLSALAALTLVLLLAWQGRIGRHRRTTERVSASTGNRSGA